jgi:flagellar hook-length control protein FliK
MIPLEIPNRLQPSADLALRPTPPAQEITDKLPGLVAGQRLLAEVQSLLPNGTYRALINQRNVTLALPFAAKSGDAIELEVAESNGKLTLAVVARGAAEGGKAGNEASATQLSRTGQLIGTLLAGSTRDGKGSAPPLALNGNQPIAAAPLGAAQALMPLLKQAIVQSGMFYEAHQAEWVEGRYSKAQLQQEPQGKLPPGSAAPHASPANNPAASLARTAADGAPTPGAAGEPAGRAGAMQSAPSAPSAQAAAPTQLAQPVAPQAQGLVQQQLEAFATQNFSWHGQVWPGQQMQWEIQNQTEDRAADHDSAGEKWQTRLHLTLPRLGEVDARLHIHGQQLTLTMTARDAQTRVLLRSEAAALHNQLEQAGLDLALLGIAAPQESPADVQPAE